MGGYSPTIRPSSVPSVEQKAALAGSFGTPSSTNPFITAEDPKFVGTAKIIHVNPEGTHGFASVKAAVESILDNAYDNQYVIKIAPGHYIEAPFEMKPYVCLHGEGGYASVCLETSIAAAHFITTVGASEIWNVALIGPPDTGMAAIFHEDESVLPAILCNVAIRSGYFGVYLSPVNSMGIVHAHQVVNHSSAVGAINTMFNVEGYGVLAGLMSGVMSGPSGAVGTGWSAVGPNAEITLDACYHRNAGSTGFYIDNGAHVRGANTVISRGEYGIRIGPNGSSDVKLIQTHITPNVTNHILTESPTATLFFTGVAINDRVVLEPGTTFVGSFMDEEANASHFEGAVNAESPAGDEFSLGPLLVANSSTGIASGGQVDQVAGVGNERKLDVGSGTGFVVDAVNGSIKPVSWADEQIEVVAAGLYYIYVDSDGVVQADTVEPSYSDVVMLALAGTDGSVITGLFDHRIEVMQTVPSLEEYIEEVIGPICAFGCVATVNGSFANKVDVGQGGYFKSLHEQLVNGDTPVVFNYHYRNGSGGWIIGNDTDTFTSPNYDDGSGTLAAVPAGKYHRQLLYVSTKPDGTDLYHVFYAQEYYDSQQEAETGNNPSVAGLPCGKYGLRVCGVVMQQGSSNIVSIVDQRPFIGQSASGVTSFADHGSLAGLGDDDHSQYYNQSRGDARWALIAKGVTNGDSHDHAGGDGGQIAHSNLSGVGTNTHAQVDSHIAALAPHSGHAAASHTHDHGNELSGLNDDDHPHYHNDARGDLRYAPIAKGVTNGDTHNHSGGDGGQISHTALSDVGTNTHADIDTHISSGPHVTGGDAHDHSGGDGAQIAHTALSSIGTNTHAQIDSHISSLSGLHTRWTTLSKAADLQRNNTATVSADPDLQFSMTANTKYIVRGRIFYTTTNAADFKWRHAGPLSPTVVSLKRSSIVPGATTLGGIAVDTAFSAADITMTANAAGEGYIEFEASIQNGNNAGTFSFQWAQNTSDAGPTAVRAGSYIEYATA